MIICSCCCCHIPTIVVWNSNALIDDNFKILINGTDIGHIDNNSNTYTGRIFSSDTGVTSSNHPATTTSFGSPPNFQSTLLLDTPPLVKGSNTLRIESIQNNGNGNLGHVLIECLNFNGSTYSIQKIKFDGIYIFSSGVGNGQDYTFSYP